MDGAAIVTGAAGGIGKAIATVLTASGMSVALIDRDAHALEKVLNDLASQGRRVNAWCCDVEVSAAVSRTVDEVVADLGPPLVLVNNAGVMRDAAVQDMTDEEWDTVLGSNVAGSFFMNRAVVPHMTRAQTGRIVHISSRSALGNPYRVNYSSAKAALQGMTRALAWELGPAGITVNCVAPGHITTAMTKGMAARAGLSYEQYRTSAAADSSMRRVGTPEDVAQAVAYFVSPGAAYTTGQILYVAGKPTV